MMKVKVLLLSGLSLTLAACSEDVGPKDYVKIAGGGFVFNYRYSQAYYVFVAQQVLPLPEGSILEASFDVPGSTVRFLTELPAMKGKLHYKFQSEVLRGIVKNQPYKVTLRLLDKTKLIELDRDEATYKSDVDQSELPSVPPVEGVDFKPIIKAQ